MPPESLVIGTNRLPGSGGGHADDDDLVALRLRSGWYHLVHRLRSGGAHARALSCVPWPRQDVVPSRRAWHLVADHIPEGGVVLRCVCRCAAPKTRSPPIVLRVSRNTVPKNANTAKNTVPI